MPEGSPNAKVRADEQKSHRRLSLRASWHHTTKPRVTADRVNAAVVQRQLMFLFGEICAIERCWSRRVYQRGLLVDKGPGARGAAAQCERNRQWSQDQHSAPCSNAWRDLHRSQPRP